MYKGLHVKIHHCRESIKQNYYIEYPVYRGWL
jgi:hypothetical protein